MPFSPTIPPTAFDITPSTPPSTDPSHPSLHPLHRPLPYLFKGLRINTALRLLWGRTFCAPYLFKGLRRPSAYPSTYPSSSPHPAYSTAEQQSPQASGQITRPGEMRGAIESLTKRLPAWFPSASKIEFMATITAPGIVTP